MNMVSRLQDENRRILKQQSTSPSHNPDQQSPPNDNPTTPAVIQKNKEDKPAASGQADLQLLQRLRGQIEKQRHDLKMSELDLQAKSSEVENVIKISLQNMALFIIGYEFTVNSANGSCCVLKPGVAQTPKVATGASANAGRRASRLPSPNAGSASGNYWSQKATGHC